MSNKRVYRYKDYIDIDNISIDEEKDYRYSLSIPYKNQNCNKNVLIIMRNPSKANKEFSDRTINNVLEFCNNKYNKVNIVNLYPYYETDSTKLKDFIELEIYDAKMKRNSQIIENLYGKNNDIIIGWGANNSGVKYNENYENTINALLDKLNKYDKKIYAMRFSSSINPWHPRNWGGSFGLELYEWNT